LEGEIHPEFFRCNYWEPTNFGDEITCAKYFATREDAERFALKLVEEMKEGYEESDDMPHVEIVDQDDSVLKAWRMEGGRVVEYPNGW